MKPEKQATLNLDACHEIQIHYKRPLFKKMPKVESPEEAAILFKKYIDPNRIDHKEFFWVMLCTRASRVLGITEIASGALTQVIIPVREIIQLALITNAAGIILCHNHPSGSHIFSEKDIQITEKLTELCNLFNIAVIDHLIITSESYASFDETIGFD